MVEGIQGASIDEYYSSVNKKIADITENLTDLKNGKTPITTKISQLQMLLLENKDVNGLLQSAIIREKEMTNIQIAIESLISMNVIVTEDTDLFSLKKWLSKLEGATKVISENSEMSILLKENDKIGERFSEAKQRLERCNIAVEALGRLENLEKYSEHFIDSNLQKIAILFRKLHLPPEFTDLKRVGKEIVICRPNSSQYIHINQMSMGQRTSLALAILFQMHIMGKDTPRILLLDEPVSNLDDIHIMNMVDILRELALNGA